jgi:hypothetical protein
MKSAFLQNTKIQIYNLPWEHIIIDDFLPTEIFSEVQKKLCSIQDGFLRQNDDIFDLNYMFLPHLNLAKLFLSDEFSDFLGKITNTTPTINETNLVQLRKMDHASPGLPPHTDDSENPSLAVIYYLSENRKCDLGGDLLLHPGKEQISRDESKVIKPLANRMVIFSANDTNWHSVSKVENWNRFSIISEWFT